MADGWSPIASHRIEWTLEPGESRRALFMLGYVEVDPADKWERPGVANKGPSRQLQAP